MKLHNRKLDFSNIELILEKKVPNRPTLFEFMINWNVIQILADKKSNLDDYTDAAATY